MSKQATHTPGPLIGQMRHCNKMGYSIEWPDGSRSWMPDYQTARATAAAPAMLEALEAAARVIGESDSTVWGDAWDKVSSAIALARGGEA